MIETLKRLRIQYSCWLFIWLLFLVFPVEAKNKITGTTGGQILKIDASARAAAMAGAFSPLADDLWAINYNPAGLIKLGTISFGAMHNEWLQGIKYEYLGYTQKLKIGYDEEAREIGAMGISLIYLYMDKIQGSRFASGGGFEKAPDFDASSKLAILSYAFQMNKSLSSGFNLKLLKENIERESASTITFDLGFLYKTILNRLNFGLCLQNIGGSLRFIEARNDLPMNMRGGISYKLLNDSLTTCLEINKPRDNDLNINLGVEYWIIKPIALRAGYKTNTDIGEGFSTGMGVKISGYSIDYAFVPYGKIGEAHRLSMLLRF